LDPTKKSTFFNRPIRYEPVESLTSEAIDKEYGIASFSTPKCPAGDLFKLSDDSRQSKLSHSQLLTGKVRGKKKKRQTKAG